jgi:hypothetical protein
MKPFFIEIQIFLAWAGKFWGTWGIFGQTISTHFDTVSNTLFNHYFYKKLSLYIHNPNIYLGL